MVMRAGIETRCDRKLKDGALLGVVSREQIIDTGLM
jgi:hypothetical protein